MKTRNPVAGDGTGKLNISLTLMALSKADMNQPIKGVIDIWITFLMDTCLKTIFNSPKINFWNI